MDNGLCILHFIVCFIQPFHIILKYCIYYCTVDLDIFMYVVANMFIVYKVSLWTAMYHTLPSAAPPLR